MRIKYILLYKCRRFIRRSRRVWFCYAADKERF